MEEKIDLRTPREAAYDRECEAVAVRFRELMEYAPSASRAMERVAYEFHTSRETVRARLIHAGAYTPGKRVGRRNGNEVRG